MSLLSLAISLGLAGIQRALTIISSLVVQVNVVGEGPFGSVGGEDPRPKVELGFFSPCTLVGIFPSQRDIPPLLVLCRETCRASGNMEIVGL